MSLNTVRGVYNIGAADAVTKAYIRKNEVFADAFNYFMYDGEQKIRPEQLRELDTTEIAILLNEKDTKDNKNTKDRKYNKDNNASESKPVQKYRDLLKSAAIMEDGEAAYVLLGIENQTEVHYAMPVRNMLYDAMQYNQQVADTAAKHKEEKSRRDKQKQKISNAEFLSGFHKDDKLIPVITLVLFFNAGEWDGPRSLFDMLDMSNPIFEKYAQDYKLHIISLQQIADDELEKFHSSLREVIGCIKYSKDKNKLANFIQDNPRMNMEIEAARVIEMITQIEIEKEEVDSMGNVNMCKAIEDMVQDVVDEKKDDWLSEGRLAGVAEGRLQLLTTLIQSGKVTVKEAATLMDMTQEEFLAKSKTIS